MKLFQNDNGTQLKACICKQIRFFFQQTYSFNKVLSFFSWLLHSKVYFAELKALISASDIYWLFVKCTRENEKRWPSSKWINSYIQCDSCYCITQMNGGMGVQNQEHNPSNTFYWDQPNDTKEWASFIRLDITTKNMGMYFKKGIGGMPQGTIQEIQSWKK